MGKFSLANLFGITLRESANDGSDFTNPDADYRRVFLGEDGALHAKDSSGTVTALGGDVSAHTGDTSDAHDASAISVLDTAANFTGTDVEAVLAELQDNIDGVGGGGGGWTLLVDKDGTDTTGFTSENGTWASNGTIIQQTGTGTNARLRWNTKVPQGGQTVYEVDVRFPSSTQTAGSAGTGAGLLIHHTSGASSLFTIYELEHNGTNSPIVSMEYSGVANVRQFTLGAAIAFDTWCTLRCVISGEGNAGLWVDGTFVGNAPGGAPGIQHSGASPDFVGLYCYTAKADFRNFKVWGLTLP